MITVCRIIVCIIFTCFSDIRALCFHMWVYWGCVSNFPPSFWSFPNWRRSINATVVNTSATKCTYWPRTQNKFGKGTPCVFCTHTLAKRRSSASLLPSCGGSHWSNCSHFLPFFALFCRLSWNLPPLITLLPPFSLSDTNFLFIVQPHHKNNTSSHVS